ncbi:hypothetical protein [Bradyrhizobium sp. BR 1432]|uniref:hypothetical protein n=1 Tax=Bradyrhizobium sp. BR 1432 TaxID=3447966 RepID=UPI003EE6171F
MVEHRGVRCVWWHWSSDDLRHRDLAAGLFVSTLPRRAFDATTFEVWRALANGASVVPYPECAIARRRRWSLDHLIDQGITIAWMTARLFDVYVGEGRSTSGLQQLLVGGEEV